VNTSGPDCDVVETPPSFSQALDDAKTTATAVARGPQGATKTAHGKVTLLTPR
jgi:hypothetical protein